MTGRPTVAVVGAGFSGLLTALHLAADPDGPVVRLIERGDAFARGAAYSTANPDHLLNVRVSNMSAYPHDPEHFTRWLSQHEGWSSHGGFVTRGVYGDYLQDLLRRALKETGGDRLLLEHDEAVDVERSGAGWRVRLALGRTIEASAVVLALGVLRPAPPASAAAALLESGRYIGDPWDPKARLDEEATDVLLLGAGLTMIDVAISLWRPGRRFVAISRRGLMARPHASTGAELTINPAGSPLQLLRAVRKASENGRWREAIDALRPHVQSIWLGWSLAERRAFLRHLRPWWDVHRHRLAAGAARRIGLMMRGCELVVRAGQITGLDLGKDEVEVAWRPRGGRVMRRLSVDAVVNCAGLLGDLEASPDRLLSRLLARGLIRPDACRLGADVDAGSHLIGGDGVPQPGLFAVGPLTRGAFWEITSVPDIRSQAAGAAQTILSGLRRAAAA
ncbi:MAG TPA: FAD/NAD(P)-binding protein [Phenylobacterium sp.]|uniref:FAD/NAD(P)-binding protein n=1 Tax=Phenylobacterium sp. TaxID=1871053 RepID=UPI002F95D511